MPLFTTIAGGVSAGADAIGIDFGDVFKPITSLFGGGDDCTPAKRQTAVELKNALQTYTTRAERVQLVGMAYNDIAPTPDAMAKFYIGGRDCKHKNVHPKDQQFLDAVVPFVKRKIAKEQSRAQSAMAVSTGTQKAGFSSPLLIGVLLLAGIGFIFNQSK